MTKKFPLSQRLFKYFQIFSFQALYKWGNLGKRKKFCINNFWPIVKTEIVIFKK